MIKSASSGHDFLRFPRIAKVISRKKYLRQCQICCFCTSLKFERAFKFGTLPYKSQPWLCLSHIPFDMANVLDQPLQICGQVAKILRLFRSLDWRKVASCYNLDNRNFKNPVVFCGLVLFIFKHFFSVADFSKFYCRLQIYSRKKWMGWVLWDWWCWIFVQYISRSFP